MRARLPLTVALALATPLLLADTAKPRDSSSGGSRSSAADRHPSPSSGGHSSSSASSGSPSHSSSTPRTEAQARHPRPGTGHGSRSRGGRYYPGYGGYYGGYYGGGYYGGYYRYGYPYYYGYSDPYYYPPYYPYRNSYRDYGSLRLLVEPNKTRVYVDGYFAGEADDFDGIFQRLNVSPGRHEITLKLEGYRTHRVRLYVPEDHTVKLRHDMLRGEGEDALDDRVGGPEHRWRDDARDDRRADDEGEPAEREPAARRDDGQDDATSADAATLRLHVTPEDASIYVDGRFRGTGRQLDDLLMPPGKHRVEVVRPGFRTYDQELDVLTEEPLDVKIALDRL